MRSMSRRASEGFAPNVIKGDFRLPGHPVTPDRSVPLLLYGKIAAGTSTPLCATTPDH